MLPRPSRDLQANTPARWAMVAVDYWIMPVVTDGATD
jgi:hypothetical protein